MKTTLLFGSISLICLLSISAQAAPPRDCFVIGLPGNPCDRNGYGAVPYAYRIGKSRVTNQEYAEFLNSVDPRGTNGRTLYNPEMGSSPRGGIALIPGNAEGEKYVVKERHASRPVLFVSWADAARYTNWLCNGGAPGASTENGAYDLAASRGKRTARLEHAKYWIPNENEWYKAAFYQSGPDGRPRFARRTLWHDSIRGGVMGEIVDTAPPQAVPPPVAEKLDEPPARFSCSLPADLQDEAMLQGFRVASVVEAGGGKEAKALAPVGEGPEDAWVSDPAFFSDPLYYPIWWYQPVVIENAEQPSS